MNPSRNYSTKTSQYNSLHGAISNTVGKHRETLPFSELKPNVDYKDKCIVGKLEYLSDVKRRPKNGLLRKCLITDASGIDTKSNSHKLSVFLFNHIADCSREAELGCYFMIINFEVENLTLGSQHQKGMALLPVQVLVTDDSELCVMKKTVVSDKDSSKEKEPEPQPSISHSDSFDFAQPSTSTGISHTRNRRPDTNKRKSEQSAQKVITNMTEKKTSQKSNNEPQKRKIQDSQVSNYSIDDTERTDENRLSSPTKSTPKKKKKVEERTTKRSPSKTYIYTPLNELAVSTDLKQVYHVYGVVESCQLKINPKPQSSILSMTISDATTKDFSATVYITADESVPDVHPGDIARLHRMLVENVRNSLKGRCLAAKSILIFSREDRGEAPKSTAKTYTYTPDDKAVVQCLFSWSDRRHCKLISEIAVGDTANILCQVLAVYFPRSSDSVLLTVWDGTKNDDILSETRPGIRQNEDTHLLKIAKDCAIKLWVNGGYTLAAGELQPRQYVEIRGIETYCPRSSNKASLSLRPPIRAGCGIFVVDDDDVQLADLKSRLECIVEQSSQNIPPMDSNDISFLLSCGIVDPNQPPSNQSTPKKSEEPITPTKTSSESKLSVFENSQSLFSRTLHQSAAEQQQQMLLQNLAEIDSNNDKETTNAATVDLDATFVPDVHLNTDVSYGTSATAGNKQITSKTQPSFIQAIKAINVPSTQDMTSAQVEKVSSVSTSETSVDSTAKSDPKLAAQVEIPPSLSTTSTNAENVVPHISPTQVENSAAESLARVEKMDVPSSAQVEVPVDKVSTQVERPMNIQSSTQVERTLNIPSSAEVEAPCGEILTQVERPMNIPPSAEVEVPLGEVLTQAERPMLQPFAQVEVSCSESLSVLQVETRREELLSQVEAPLTQTSTQTEDSKVKANAVRRVHFDTNISNNNGKAHEVPPNSYSKSQPVTNVEPLSQRAYQSQVRVHQDDLKNRPSTSTHVSATTSGQVSDITPALSQQRPLTLLKVPERDVVSVIKASIQPGQFTQGFGNPDHEQNILSQLHLSQYQQSQNLSSQYQSTQQFTQPSQYIGSQYTLTSAQPQVHISQLSQLRSSQMVGTSVDSQELLAKDAISSTAEHSNIKYSKMSEVITHSVPYKFRILSIVLEMQPDAHSVTKLIRLYCPHCHFLTEDATPDLPVESVRDGINIFHCPECVHLASTSQSNSSTVELEYAFLLCFSIQDGTQSGSIDVFVWRENAVKLFKNTTPEEALMYPNVANSIFEMLYTICPNARSMGLADEDHPWASYPTLDCCIMSYTAGGCTRYQMFDTILL